MQRKLAASIAAVTAIAILAVPTVASAHVRFVTAGPPPSAAHAIPKAFAKKFNPDANAFFGRHVTINAGDTVTFQQDGFHTIDIPAKGGHALPLILAGGIVTGQKDAAGNPFWFNGKVPNASLNPALFAPIGGHSYNGSSRVDTGLPLGGGAPKPFKVKFTKAGTYHFFCDVHPGMQGVIVVKKKGAKIPSNASYKAQVAKQVAGIVKDAIRLSKIKQPKNHVSIGEAARSGAELFGMFPGKLTVKRGTTVSFSISKPSFETHTATFGPSAYITSLSNGFQGATFPPIGVYPSDPVPVLTLTPTSHGNGFANLGVKDNNKNTPFTTSGKIDFTAKGTYHYICLIHPFMHGTIVVK